jgi:hypothetical protein
MTGDMKGYTTTWYEICNADGHPLVIPQGENSFLTEDIAAEVAAEVCIEYRDAVTVKEHVVTIKRVFRVEIDAVEV